MGDIKPTVDAAIIVRPTADTILPVLDVALDALLRARDAATETIASHSAVAAALTAEVSELRSQAADLMEQVNTERAVRKTEQEAISAEREAFAELKRRLSAECVELLREKDAAVRQLTEERALRSTAMRVKDETAHGSAPAEKQSLIPDLRAAAGQSSIPQKRPNPGGIQVKREEPEVKIRKLVSTKDSPAYAAPGTRKVEVVITRRPWGMQSRTSAQSARSSRTGQERHPQPGDPSMVLAPEDSPVLAARYHTLFDIPASPRRILVAQDIHLFDFATLPPRNKGGSSSPYGCAWFIHNTSSSQEEGQTRSIQVRSLVIILPMTHIDVNVPLSLGNPRMVSRPLNDAGTAAPALLEAPIFKRCGWATEFFEKTTTLRALFEDPCLQEYAPFIRRLHELNEAGVPPAPHWRGDKELPHAVFFEEDVDLRTANVGTPSFVYAWGCVVRFRLLDMLLRCKGYKASTAVGADGSPIPPGSRTFTVKLYKWEQYLTDITLNSRGREEAGVATGEAFQAAGTESDSALAYRNVLLATLCIMLILEETYLLPIDEPPRPFYFASLSNFDKFPAGVRAQLPKSVPATTVYRHLAFFLFVSPLCALAEHDLDASKVLHQALFLTAGALGTARPTLTDSGETYLRNVVRALIADPALGVAGAFVQTQGAPRYVPPPYNDSFFSAGIVRPRYR
ncbi:hypothetical protein B0H15DRAFT_868652 [Mycena belliarum]|uniref:Uncharacterized protein n=1 Tax=Mycena belliarum TaxID=1033014 RepID=A0AAD6TNJ7_9AGAR|nr:hypothetical protein B0H15DRAFT_868652 [Mycena belliae]